MRRSRHKLQVSTFPFLAVLLGAMGALILLLLVMDRRSKVVARNRAIAAHAELVATRSKMQNQLQHHQEEDEAAARQEWERKRQQLHELLRTQEQELVTERDQLDAKLKSLNQDLSKEQQALLGLEKSILDERARLDLKGQLLAQMKQGIAQYAQRDEKSRQDVEKLALDLAQLERAFQEARALKSQEGETYSLVPYRGKLGEGRRPVYVECTAVGLVFHPDEKSLHLSEFDTQTFRTEVEQRGVNLVKEKRDPSRPPTAKSNTNPYVLFLVRPDGMDMYYKAVSALRGFDLDFGYEFIDAQWALNFSGSDGFPGQKTASPSRLTSVARAPALPDVPLPPPLPPGYGQGPAGVGSGSGAPSGSTGGYRAGYGSGYGSPVANAPGSPSGESGYGPRLGPVAGAVPLAGIGSGGGGVGVAMAKAGSGIGGGYGPGGYGPGSTSGGPGLSGSGYGPAGNQGVGTQATNQGGYPGPSNPGIAPPGQSGGSFQNVPSGQAGSAPGNNQGSYPGQGTPTGGSTGQVPGNPPNAPGGPGNPQPSNNQAGVPGTNNPGGAPGSQPNAVPQDAQWRDGQGTTPQNPGPPGSPGAGQGGGIPGSGTTGSGTPGTGGVNGGGGDPGPMNPLARMASRTPYDDLQRGPKKPQPAPSVGRMLANRDYMITIECFKDVVALYPSGQVFSMANGADQSKLDEALVRSVLQLIARRQATVGAGETPYRPLLRFQIHPDAMRTYFHVYPLFENLRIPLTRENLDN